MSVTLSVRHRVQRGQSESCAAKTADGAGLKFGHPVQDVTGECSVKFPVVGSLEWHVARAGKTPISPSVQHGDICERNARKRQNALDTGALLNNSAAGWPIGAGPTLAYSGLTGVVNGMSVGGQLAARAQREALSVKNSPFSTSSGILLRIR